MTRTVRSLLLSTGIVASMAVTPQAADARVSKSACAVRTADGTGISSKAAQFQVYETLLQATGWKVWAAWMADGSTPGYKVRPAKYNCRAGTGLGVTCRGQATICKL